MYFDFRGSRPVGKIRILNFYPVPILPVSVNNDHLNTLLCNFISFLGNPDALNGGYDAEGSSNIFSYTYHGTGPFSEPETKAVKLATDYIIQDHGADK